jgi:hypothetical protein
MKGSIIFANQRIGRYGVQIDGRDLMAFELLEGCVLEGGETLTGDLESLGCETLQSKAQGPISVSIEIVHGNRPTVRRWVAGG